MIGAWIGLARAQEAPEPVAATFNADRVLVATFQAEDPESEADAARLFEQMVAAVGARNELVPMSEVPRFEPQDYGADLYMRGCPPNRYSGCALVIGQRVDTDRVLGATVRRDPDEFDPTHSQLVLTVHVVDVVEAREIASFGIPVPADREAATLAGVARVFDDIVRGDYELRDLRPEGPSADELQLEQERKERLAASLAALETELGTAVRSEDAGWVDVKLTRADLADYANRDEPPPWERMDLRPGAWIRYANSGMDLDTWRRTGNGRFGKVLIRAGGGFGGGPWHQSYAGQVLLSDQDLQPVNTVQLLEVIGGQAMTGNLELGFGVTPFLDLSFAATVRSGSTDYLIDEDVQNQVSVPSRPSVYGMTTWQRGLRAEVAPFPRWPARPTIGGGLAWWTGAGIPASDRLDRVSPPDALLLEVIPGVEGDATREVGLSLRGIVSVPLAAEYERRVETGEALIQNPPVASGDRGIGFGVVAGLTVRIGPVWSLGGSRSGRVDSFDDP